VFPVSARAGCHRAAGIILPAEQPSGRSDKCGEDCAWDGETALADGGGMLPGAAPRSDSEQPPARILGGPAEISSFTRETFGIPEKSPRPGNGRARQMAQAAPFPPVFDLRHPLAGSRRRDARLVGRTAPCRGRLFPLWEQTKVPGEVRQIAPKTARVPCLAGFSCVRRHSHEEDESTGKIAENRRPRVL